MPDYERWAGREEQLLVAVADGDQRAFAQLYDCLSPAVFGLVVRLVRDRGFAEEVCQEVFTELWRGAPGYDPVRARARTWVLTLAHRRAVDRIRREEAARRRDDRFINDLGDLGSTPPVDDQVVEHLRAADEGARVRAALASLSEVQRQAVELAYFDGLTYPQVATHLGVPLGTIKTRVRDALGRLRETLGVAT